MTERILIYAPDCIGDMVMANALMKSLHDLYDDIQIDVLAPRSTYELALRMNEVNAVILCDLPRKKLALLQRYKLGKSLRGNYDSVIVLPNSFKAALVPFFAKILHRRAWLGKLRFGLVNDIRYFKEKEFTLMVSRYVALAYDIEEVKTQEEIPRLPLPSLYPDHDHLSYFLEQNKFKTTQYHVALCPGAEFGKSKQWPVEYFAELAVRLLEEGNTVLLLGSPKETDIGLAIENFVKEHCNLPVFHNLIGKTSLLEAVDLLSIMNVAVTNDSGLMHVSAALKTPLVALYGPTTPLHTPPLSKTNVVLYKGDGLEDLKKSNRHKYHPNLLKISVDEVYESTIRLL